MNLSSIQQLREELLKASEEKASELEEYLALEEQRRTSEEVLNKAVELDNHELESVQSCLIWSAGPPNQSQ